MKVKLKEKTELEKRVEKSPLQFFIQRYVENNLAAGDNLLPESANFIYRTKHSGNFKEEFN